MAQEGTELLKVSDVAVRLNVHPKTAERFVRRGIFPNAVMVEGSYRIPSSDIDAYLAANRVKPQGENKGAA